MWKYLKSFIWNEPKNSINPNSMSPLPSSRFINYARSRAKINEDNEPHDDYYHLKRMERIYGKSMKQRKQQETYYDYFNH